MPRFFGDGSFSNIADTLEASALRVPNRAAIKYGSQSLSYADLNNVLNQMARVLLRHGVRVGDRVAYIMPNSIEIVALYYAIQRIGAVAVPVPYRFLPNEIACIVDSCAPVLLVYQDARQGDIDEAQAQSKTSCTAMSLGELAEGAKLEPHDSPEKACDPNLISRIQYTGGSTGVPKGAVRTHAADLAEFDGVIGSNGMGERDDNVVLIQSPLEHHGGHSWFTTTIALGATLVLCGKFDTKVILDTIERERVTYVLILPPTSYERLLSDSAAATTDLSSVRVVQSSAGAAPRSSIEAIYRFFPNAVMNYGWGQSESGIGTSIALTREMLGSDSRLLGSIGWPMPGMELRIVDEDGNDVPNGAPGEALARSKALMSEYWGRPDLTEKVFEGEWLRTGDVMLRDDGGCYYLVSRIKDMIKSGGENVFAAEVEGVLLAHPDITDCAVFGVSDPVMVEAVAAAIQLQPGATVSIEDVQAWCKSKIASYKKPRYIMFMDNLGRNDAGKIDKNALKRCFEACRTKE